MDNLADVLKTEVRWYAGSGQGANIRLVPVLDDMNQVYAVTAIPYPERTRAAGVMVMARIWADKVIIEEDRTDRPLLAALLQAGIPREQIICAYAGEPLPDLAPT